jgi:hypothetical protein
MEPDPTFNLFEGVLQLEEAVVEIIPDPGEFPVLPDPG